MDSGTFVTLTTRIFFLKKKIRVTKLGIFNETDFPELRNSGILVLLNKDEICELRHLELLFSLEVPSYKKLTVTS